MCTTKILVLNEKYSISQRHTWRGGTTVVICLNILCAYYEQLFITSMFTVSLPRTELWKLLWHVIDPHFMPLHQKKKTASMNRDFVLSQRRHLSIKKRQRQTHPLLSSNMSRMTDYWRKPVLNADAAKVSRSQYVAWLLKCTRRGTSA